MDLFDEHLKTRLSGIKRVAGGNQTSIAFVLKLARIGLHTIKKEDPDMEYKTFIRRLDEIDDDQNDDESDDESDESGDDDGERPRKRRCVSP